MEYCIREYCGHYYLLSYNEATAFELLKYSDPILLEENFDHLRLMDGLKSLSFTEPIIDEI